MVGGCSNTTSNGCSVFVASGEQRRSWRDFITTTVAGFRNEHIHICSGHFVEGDFNKSQVIQFVTGHRKQLPGILQTAVPSVKVAVNHTFPTVREIYSPAPTTTTSSTGTATTMTTPTPSIQENKVASSPAMGMGVSETPTTSRLSDMESRRIPAYSRRKVKSVSATNEHFYYLP